MLQKLTNFSFNFLPVVKFKTGESTVLVNKIAYLYALPKKGDIVIAKHFYKKSSSYLLTKVVKKVQQKKILLVDTEDKRKSMWVEKNSIIGQVILN